MGEHIEIDPNDRGWLKKLGLHSVEQVLGLACSDVAAISRSSDVVRIKLDPGMGGPDSIFVKRYLYDHRSQRIKQMFRGTLFGKSRASFEYEFLNEMKRRHVPTARPIAYGERRGWLFLRASFLITEGLLGVESLDVYAINRSETPAHYGKSKRSLIDELGSAIGQMHQAGVMHGGLFWRNILIRPQADHKERFLFLDPDSHGRLTRGSVSRTQAISDLSDVAASALAYDMRAGMMRLMRSYFQTPSLSKDKRNMIRRIITIAHRKAQAERQRLAVTDTIGRLRKKITYTSDSPRVGHNVNSIEEFFDLLSHIKADQKAYANKKQTVHFLLADSDTNGMSSDRTLTIQNGFFSVTKGIEGQANLTIKADTSTWLSIVTGKADAFAMIRSGGLEVSGDTQLLAMLAKLV